MSRKSSNPLKILEASTGIEPVYTDLQSGLKTKQNKGVSFQNMPRQNGNFPRKFQTPN
ncbi:hypothetical protein C8N42_106257 [Celeribacter persicus]|uniref:Uncharacterized protein n=1 Tax=Celeribacter persicus TaxID=1651082 RepID=A0A2T5HMD4_9RHOB|nr:hypothetical protein C8N42_106257 [Celeribacter persicus]